MRTQRPAPLAPGLYPNALHADGLQPGQFPTLNDRVGVGAQQAEDVVARLAAESFDHDRHFGGGHGEVVLVLLAGRVGGLTGPGR